jgi:hypothetical protein
MKRSNVAKAFAIISLISLLGITFFAYIPFILQSSAPQETTEIELNESIEEPTTEISIEIE